MKKDNPTADAEPEKLLHFLGSSISEMMFDFRVMDAEVLSLDINKGKLQFLLFVIYSLLLQTVLLSLDFCMPLRSLSAFLSRDSRKGVQGVIAPII